MRSSKWQNNRLQDLDDGDIQKLQTFLGWMEEK